MFHSSSVIFLQCIIFMFYVSTSVSVNSNTYTVKSHGWCSRTGCWASGGAGHTRSAPTSGAGCSERRQTCSSPRRSWTHTGVNIKTHPGFSSWWLYLIFPLQCPGGSLIKTRNTFPTTCLIRFWLWTFFCTVCIYTVAI